MSLDFAIQTVSINALNTEYSVALNNVRAVSFSARDNEEILWSIGTGFFPVTGSGDNYDTLVDYSSWESPDTNMDATTTFTFAFQKASGSVPTAVVIEVWSDA